MRGRTAATQEAPMLNEKLHTQCGLDQQHLSPNMTTTSPQKNISEKLDDIVIVVVVGGGGLVFFYFTTLLYIYIM